MTVDTPYRYDASAFRAVFEHNFTYLAGVRRNSHRFANQPALHDPASGRRWTYAELWADSGRLADALRASNVRPGDAIVFALFNGPEFVLTWLAAQRLGAIPAPINFRLSAGEVAYVIDDSQPTAFVYDQTLATTAADAITRAEHQPSLLVAVGRDTAPATPFDELLELGDPHADPEPPPDATVYDETSRLYTSGYDRMPKAVPLTSLNEVLTAHDVIMHFPPSPRPTRR